ncbi:MAG: exodeoxyribonuclease III [Candidatus Saccharimonadales bacterium]
MRIYSWNVNGIRAVINKGALTEFIRNEQPDILCLQEIKANPDQFNLGLEGYRAFWYPAEKPGYSGTGILTKLEPLATTNGLPEDIIKKHHLTGDIYGDPNLEGRVLAAEYPNFNLVTVYTPNAKDDLSRLELRHKQWDPAFLEYVKILNNKKPVIFCGDLNVAHTEDDLANPGPNKGKKGFTDEERQGIQAYLDAGFIDSFRQFKKGNGYYTWWSHFANSRARNVGWRIDYFLISSLLTNKLKAAEIHPQYMGSDHCPISTEINI